MSESVNEPVVDQGLGLMPKDDSQQLEPTQQPTEDKINPAWNDLLSQVPSNLHGIITPKLKEWDTNYQQGLQKVHSQYEPYKPFVDQKIDPTELNNALLIMQNLEQDPEKFARALVEHYGLKLGEQGQQQPNPQDQQLTDEDPVFDITQHPEFQRITGLTETMAKALIAQNDETQRQQVEVQIDTELQAAKEKYKDKPPFDEGYVFQYAATNDCDLDTAVQAYYKMAENIVTNYRSPGQNAPVIMGGGGGLPSQQTPVGSMTGQQRRQLIVQTLNNLKAQGG